MVAWSLGDKLVVILGETASGKSALAIELAEKFDGEIVCADSRTVYRGMDIGTAKPSAEDQARIPHHLIDVIEPNENFSVAEFQRLANRVVTDITARGKLPILVGGTGLYIDSVVYDYQFQDSDERDPVNPRHRKDASAPDREVLRGNTLIIGIALEREVLEKRVDLRVEQMLKDGFVGEVERLIERYGKDLPAFQAPGYKAFTAYLRGELNLDEAKEQFKRSDLQLARRQRTWFKRNKSIHWISSSNEAIKLTTQFVKNTVSSRT